MTTRTYRRIRWAAAAALLLAALPLHAQAPRAKRDAALEKELAGLAAEVRGTVGIYVRHLKTGRTAELNADSVFPTASMVKVPILVTLFDRMDRGLLGMHDTLVYRDSLLYPGEDLLGSVLEWAGSHLAEDISVDALARRALMSPRSFARRFKATTGTTPHAWLLGQRLAAAEALLEESDAPVEEIARLVGFGTAAGLREQFGRRRGVSPRAYRQTFRAGSARGAAPVQLDGHRAGRVGSDQTLVEAEFGQPA